MVSVRLEVKEFRTSGKANRLYFTVTIKEAGIFTVEPDYPEGTSGLAATPASSKVNITDLLSNVKRWDYEILKYFPDSMLFASLAGEKRKPGFLKNAKK